MRTLSAGLGLVLLTLASISFAKERAKVEDSLLVKLSLKEKRVALGQPILARLTVENRGKSSVRFIRPRRKNMTRIHEHGWGIKITGSQGVYGHYPEPRAVQPVVDSDIIELAPGESLGIDLNIAHYELLKKTERTRKEVGQTVGKYKAVLTYDARNRGPFFLKKEKQISLFLGPVSSKAVEFEITKKQEKQKSTDQK